MEPPPRPFQVVEGDRAKLEAEIVEDLFLNRYDPTKAARLKPAGRLVLIRSGEARKSRRCIWSS